MNSPPLCRSRSLDRMAAAEVSNDRRRRERSPFRTLSRPRRGQIPLPNGPMHITDRQTRKKLFESYHHVFHELCIRPPAHPCLLGEIACGMESASIDTVLITVSHCVQQPHRPLARLAMDASVASAEATTCRPATLPPRPSFPWECSRE